MFHTFATAITTTAAIGAVVAGVRAIGGDTEATEPNAWGLRGYQEV